MPSVYFTDFREMVTWQQCKRLHADLLALTPFFPDSPILPDVRRESLALCGSIASASMWQGKRCADGFADALADAHALKSSLWIFKRSVAPATPGTADPEAVRLLEDASETLRLVIKMLAGLVHACCGGKDPIRPSQSSD